jgi:hypothetical protein
MSAAELVTNLLKAARGLADAYREAKKANSALKLLDFTKSSGAKDVVEKVESLLSGLNTASLEAAIKEAAGKRFKLLKGRTVFDLTETEAAQYDALVETEDKLFDQVNAKLQHRDALYTWLAEEGLSVLKKVATIVVPLLL